MDHQSPPTGRRRRRGIVGAGALFGLLLVSGAGRAEPSPPVKLTVLDFTLDDRSAGASLAGESSADIAQLQLATDEARRLLAESGRYSLVDVGGAEQTLVAVVTRISRTEYTVTSQIRDARTGAVVFNGATGLRMGANDSWRRGAAWLIRNRLLASAEQP